MIFDPKLGALYANDGTFIKTVHCPMSLRVADLAALPGNSPDRYCHGCKKTIQCIDGMSDAEVLRLMDRNDEPCVFATGAAKNIVFLEPIGAPSYASSRIVIKTARNLESMADAYARGFRLVIHETGQRGEIGERYRVFQNRITGEVWWSCGDFDQYPKEGQTSDWSIVADEVYHRPDRPFPLAAYLVPRGLRRGQEVFLADVISETSIANPGRQGGTSLLLSSLATWNGDDFELNRLTGAEVLG